MNPIVRPLRPRAVPRLAIPAALLALVALALSCTENLPTGPNTFSATLSMLSLPDTLVVADSRVAAARVTDTGGHIIQELSFAWTVADTTVAKLGASDTSAGRTRTILARRGGVSRVTVSLTDARFVVSDVSKQLTVVLAGVRIATSRDTSLTALNDTAVAVANGLVKSGATYAPSAGQGVRWVHKGVATTGVGQGDTLRYVAKANGVDTLIASIDFCLAGTRCADTAYIRVAQVVKLSLSVRSFSSWSVGDSVGPSITLTDRRGNGLIGSSVRFVPVTLADSQIVSVSAPIGTTNPVNGQMAVPRLITTGNGTARVRVLGVGADGSTADVDSMTVVVRQVTRRVTAEPPMGQITEVDSLPFKLAARDARGAVIADATLAPTTTLVTYSNGRLIGVVRGAPYTGTVFATVSGAADPANNAAAPQIPYTVDTASVSVALADSADAGSTNRTFQLTVHSTPGVVSVGRWVRFFASGGLVGDSAQTNSNGQVTVDWTPPNTARRWTFSAILAGSPIPVTAADTAGRVVLRRSVVVKPGAADASLSTAEISSATVGHGEGATLTVSVRDVYGNNVPTATPSLVTFTRTAAGGSISAGTCNLGVCTFTYTATANPLLLTDTITVFINSVALPSAIVVTLFP